MSTKKTEIFSFFEINAPKKFFGAKCELFIILFSKEGKMNMHTVKKEDIEMKEKNCCDKAENKIEGSNKNAKSKKSEKNSEYDKTADEKKY